MKNKRTSEERLQRLEAYMEISNLMGRYAHWHVPGLRTEQASLFSTRDDTFAEMLWGRYYGKSGIDRLYPGLHVAAVPHPEGHMCIHSMQTPVIEVAEDLQTAKGLWMSPGVMTNSNPDGSLVGKWCWIKYAADFILEDGVWKIWHLRTPGMFQCDFHKSWVEEGPHEVPDPQEVQDQYFATNGLRDTYGPDALAKFPHITYSPDQVFHYDAPVPMPYDTYVPDDTWM